MTGLQGLTALVCLTLVIGCEEGAPTLMEADLTQALGSDLAAYIRGGAVVVDPGVGDAANVSVDARLYADGTVSGIVSTGGTVPGFASTGVRVGKVVNIEYAAWDDTWCIQFPSTYGSEAHTYAVTFWLRDRGDGIVTKDVVAVTIVQAEPPSFHPCGVARPIYWREVTQGDYKVTLAE